MFGECNGTLGILTMPFGKASCVLFPRRTGRMEYRWIDRILDRDSSLSRDDNKRAFQSLFNSLATGI